MKNIGELIAELGNTKPVFKFESRYGNDQIQLVPKEPYKPKLEGDDPLIPLIINRYHEHFDRDSRCFVKNIGEEQVFSDMMVDIREMFDRHSGYKNPQQSKMHKWLSEMKSGYNHPFRDGFIALFRYAQPKSGNKVHMDNLIAILERMKDKYEER